MEPRKKYFKLTEIARRAPGIPLSSLYRLAERGEIETIRLGSRIYVPRQQALKLMLEDERSEEPDTNNAA